MRDCPQHYKRIATEKTIDRFTELVVLSLGNHDEPHDA